MKSEDDSKGSFKRLALFFDGTWNKPENNTNVWRLALMLAESGADDVPQIKFYDEGVGTHWFDRISGGAFGFGLSENVRRGYRWLMEHYNPGDEIFLFGFSRGAFTARSLAGVIARCGLLKPDAPMSFAQLYERYQKGDKARPIYELIRQKEFSNQFDFEERTLLRYSQYRRNFIKLVGVWDTVGALGIPFGNIPGISRRTLAFHNTNLSTTVQNSFQALALDEQRKPYWAALWTNFVPVQPNSSTAASPEDRRVIEQRWFTGAHCNVGGGYRNDLLPQRPLAWIQEKACACGLAFRSNADVTDEDLATQPRDSYAEFLDGIWRFLTFGKRYERWVMADPVMKDAHWKGTKRIDDGWMETVNERIDLSVFERCKRDDNYRPPNLIEWAKRKGLNLEAVVTAPSKFTQFTDPVINTGIEHLIPKTTSTELPEATKSPKPQT